MEEAVVEQLLGQVFVERGLLVEVVEERDVHPGRGLHAVAEAAHHPRVNLLLGGDLLDRLEEHLLLEVVVGREDQLDQLVDLVQRVEPRLHLAAGPQQQLEGLEGHLVLALGEVGEAGGDHGGLVLERVGFGEAEEAALLLEVVLAVLREGEPADGVESVVVVGGDLLDGVVGEGVFLGHELRDLLPDHPRLEEGLLVEELVGGVLYLLGEAGLDVALDAVRLVVDDLDGGVVLLDGLEVADADVVGQGVGGVVVLGAGADGRETALVQLTQVLTQHLPLYLLERHLLVLERHALHPQHQLGDQRVSRLRHAHLNIIYYDNLRENSNNTHYSIQPHLIISRMTLS